MNWLFANVTWIVQTWERHPSMLEMPMVAENAVSLDSSAPRSRLCARNLLSSTNTLADAVREESGGSASVVA